MPQGNSLKGLDLENSHFVLNERKFECIKFECNTFFLIGAMVFFRIGIWKMSSVIQESLMLQNHRTN